MPAHRRSCPSSRNFLIPKEYQGCIIGKEGTIIQGIQITTGTTIRIKDSNDATKCRVLISGTSNGTRAAERKVRQVIEEHIEHAEIQKDSLELNGWKKTLGFNSRDNILLLGCTNFIQGKCNLEEVSSTLIVR